MSTTIEQSDVMEQRCAVLFAIYPGWPRVMCGQSDGIELLANDEFSELALQLVQAAIRPGNAEKNAVIRRMCTRIRELAEVST